jgi:hemin uptake protein HemP
MMPKPEPVASPSRPPAAAPAEISAETLFQGQQEVRIQHQGEQYRLRITRNGKLILTK